MYRNGLQLTLSIKKKHKYICGFVLVMVINAALAPSNSLDGRFWAMFFAICFVAVGIIGASRHEVSRSWLILNLQVGLLHFFFQLCIWYHFFESAEEEGLAWPVISVFYMPLCHITCRCRHQRSAGQRQKIRKVHLWIFFCYGSFDVFSHLLNGCEISY